jgi:hypothetical protein
MRLQLSSTAGPVDVRRIWTILPDGPDHDRPRTSWFRFSAYLTPRLGSATALAAYADFTDWPATLKTLKFALYDGAAEIAAEGNSLERIDVADSAVYRALFPPTLTVTPPGGDPSTDCPVTFCAQDVIAAVSAHATGMIAGGGAPAALNAAQRQALEDARDYVRKIKTVKDGEHCATIDFHQQVTRLAQYPVLLRLCGFVVDFRCRLALPLNEHRLSLRVRAPRDPADPQSPPAETKADQSMATLVEPPSVGVSFAARSRKTDEFAGTFLVLQSNANPDRYVTHQLDPVAEALRLTSDSDCLKTGDTGGASCSFQTAGLALFRRDTAAAVADKREDAKAFERKSVDGTKRSGQAVGVDLFFDDLVRGFRVDVRDMRDGAPWRSLCARSVSYTIGAPDGGSSTAFQLDDEGWVGISGATVDPAITPIGSKTGPDLAVHDALFRWTGWSLSARRPMSAVDKTGAADCQSNEPTIEVKPQPGSLPSLRFGRTYRFRVRVVDLAGNSKSLSAPTPAGAEGLPFTYGRFEALSPPKPVFRGDHRARENPLRLVVRSELDKRSRRYLFPPRVTAEMAERHGRLDDGGRTGKSAFATLVRFDGDLPERPESPAVPYLSDPLVTGIRCELASLDGLPNPQPVHVRYHGTWPAMLALRMVLRKTSGAAVLTIGRDEELVVALPAASRYQLKLVSLPRINDDLTAFALWNLYGKGDARLKDDVVGGLNEHFTPPVVLDLIHAVQRPRRAPAWEPRRTPVVTVQRKPGDTAATLAGKVAVDTRSTASIDLTATWYEWIDDGKTVPFRKQFSRKIYHRSDCTPTPKADGDCTPLAESNAVTAHQEFGDTKARRVYYPWRGTTRFPEYYADDKGNVTVDVTSTTKPADELSVVIPSTKVPPPPRVLFHLPTFAWATPGDPFGREVTRERHGRAVRIYLARPWFASGDDEMLGVMLRHPGSAAPAHADVMSRIGCDPTDPRASTFAPQPGGQPLDFLTASDFEDAPTAVPLTLPLSWYAADGQNVKPDTVDILPYRVHFDKTKDAWYADVVFREPNAYRPFVQLVLARYQPNALDGADLSVSTPVALPFTQLFPDRRLRYTFAHDEPRRIELTVYGAQRRDSNGAQVIVQDRKGELGPLSDELSWVSRAPVEMAQAGTSGSLYQLALHAPRSLRGCRIVVLEYETREADDRTDDGKTGDDVDPGHVGHAKKQGVAPVYLDAFLL